MVNVQFIENESDQRLEALLPLFKKHYTAEILTVVQIRKQLNISRTEYNRLRKMLLETGVPSKMGGRTRKKKREVKHIHKNVQKGHVYFHIKRNGVYFCTVKDYRDAEKIVEQLELVDWDKNELSRIREGLGV